MPQALCINTGADIPDPGFEPLQPVANIPADEHCVGTLFIKPDKMFAEKIEGR
jgi:hypothetical protein